MKTHIEYDDFGEFVEVLEDLPQDQACVGSVQIPAACRVSIMKRGLRAVLFTLMTAVIMFSTTSFASCGIWF